MQPKSKVEIAEDHLRKAQAEAVGGDLRDAVQWAFASLEATLDALAEPRGIVIDAKHWNRAKAAGQLYESGVLHDDLTELHAALNRLRKSVFYDGEELTGDDIDIEDSLRRIEDAVQVARGEADASGKGGRV